MSYIANVKLGKYQVHKIYLNDRIIWELLPSRGLHEMINYEVVFEHIPVASSLGWSKMSYMIPTTGKMAIKNATGGVSGKIPINSFNKNLSFLLHITQGSGETESNDFVTALSAIYKNLFGYGSNITKDSTINISGLNFTATMAASGLEKNIVNGGLHGINTDALTSKHDIKIISNGLLCYSARNKLSGKGNVVNYAIITNHIPKAPNSLWLRSYPISFTSGFGTIGQKQLASSTFNPHRTITNNAYNIVDSIKINGETECNSLILGLINAVTKFPMLGNSLQKNSICSSGNPIPLFYMGGLESKTRNYVDNISQCNKNTLMYVTFKTASKKNGFIHSLPITNPITKDTELEIALLNTKPKLWYPLLGYPSEKEETIIKIENNGVPLTIIDNSNLRKNRKLLKIRQAYAVTENDGMLEVN